MVVVVVENRAQNDVNVPRRGRRLLLLRFGYSVPAGVHGSCHCPRHEVVASEGVSCEGTGSAPHERRDEGKGEQPLPHVTRHTFRTQLEGSSEIASFVVMSMQRSVAASCASVRELRCSCPSSWWISRCPTHPALCACILCVGGSVAWSVPAGLPMLMRHGRGARPFRACPSSPLLLIYLSCQMRLSWSLARTLWGFPSRKSSFYHDG